jgi:hypothetical protein
MPACVQTDDHGYNALTISTFCDRAGVAEVLCQNSDTIVSIIIIIFYTSSSGRPVGCMNTLLKQHLNTHKQQSRTLGHARWE